MAKGFSQRKLLWIGYWYQQITPCPPNFAEKTFANSHKTSKFSQKFSQKLQAIQHVWVPLLDMVMPVKWCSLISIWDSHIFVASLSFCVHQVVWLTLFLCVTTAEDLGEKHVRIDSPSPHSNEGPLQDGCQHVRRGMRLTFRYSTFSPYSSKRSLIHHVRRNTASRTFPSLSDGPRQCDHCMHTHLWLGATFAVATLEATQSELWVK